MALAAQHDPGSAALASLRPPTALNVASLSLLFALAGAFAFVVFLLVRLVLPPKRTLTLTELNTLLNRHENGGTGVWARKWRKRFLAPPTFGDEDVLADAGIDARDGDEKGEWRVHSRPLPQGLRGVLKSAVEAVEDAAGEVEKAVRPASEPPADTPPAPRRRAKQVRVVEPSLDELETLRTRWASPAMQGEHGFGGIGGFRSTRDFYVRGRGGMGVVKQTAGAEEKKLEPGKAIPAAKADDADEEVEEEDSEDVPLQRALRPPRLAATSIPTRTSSNSPSPMGRRRRALSPPSPNPSGRSSSPAFIVGASSSAAKYRRPLSPNNVPGARAHSASPGPPADRAVPRWVKTKSGKLASPAPPRMAVSPDSADESTVDEDEGGSVEEETGPDADRAPPSPSSLVGIAAVAAAIPPLPSDASIAVSPVSPTFSVLSGGESPQESSTPAPAKLPPPKLAVTPSSPRSREAPTKALPPLATSSIVSPASPTSAASASSSPASPSPSSYATPSSASTTSTSASTASPTSPSPTVGAERRLSLRVSQVLRDKQGKRRAPVGPGSAIAA
ncbi:hypothetical protein JCM10450v2_001244 [Rhodotorula kratochvilovae]